MLSMKKTANYLILANKNTRFKILVSMNINNSGMGIYHTLHFREMCLCTPKNKSNFLCTPPTFYVPPHFCQTFYVPLGYINNG